jgi:tetratricopeptide (TPR) repeat protein
MKLLRARFTVKRLMATVGVLAIVLGGGIEAARLKRLRDRYLAKSEEHAGNAALALKIREIDVSGAKKLESLISKLPRGFESALSRRLDDQKLVSQELRDEIRRNASELRASATGSERSAAYHEAMHRKYRDVADRPWRTVGPDPLPPEPGERAEYWVGQARDWIERGEYRKAAAAFDEAMQSQLENAGVLNEKAWLLATCPDPAMRDGKRAAGLATRACDLVDWEDSAYLDTLAAAYAESGDFEAAAQTQQDAIRKLRPGESDKAAFESRLSLYKAGKPYRDIVSSSR